MLHDTGDKLSSADKQPVEAAIDELKKAIEKGDLADITRSMERLNQAQHRAAESLYRQAQSGGAGAPPRPERRPRGQARGRAG